MALETATYLNALVTSNPVGSDQASTADDHIRLLKACLQRTFPKITAEVSASAGLLNQAGLYANSAGYATSANYAASAGGAVSAQFATSATNATSAVFATSATNASSAVFATSATNASSAVYATTSGFAQSASAANSLRDVHVKVKTADTSCESTVAPFNDPHLYSFSCVPGDVRVSGVLYYQQGGGNLQINLANTNRNTDHQNAVKWQALTIEAGAVSVPTETLRNHAINNYAYISASGAAGVVLYVDANWECSVTSTVLGIRWCQANSDPASTTLQKGSWLRVEQITRK